MLKDGNTSKTQKSSASKRKKGSSVSPRLSRPSSATPSTATATAASSTRPSIAVVEDQSHSQRPSTSAAAGIHPHTMMVQSADRLKPTTSNLSQKPNTTRTLISGSYMGTGKRTPTVVRTTTTELGDEDPVSIEQQFYYLKLMAKPGSKPEPIKMKFVRWARPTETQLSVDDEGVLDSQAMRVVRTIGQAFEVCHKIAQDEMQEKQQIEHSESVGNLKAKAIMEEEEVEQEKATRKNSETATVEAENTGSRESSPAQPPIGPQMKRHSIYGPRKYSSDVSSQGTTIEQGGAIAASIAAAAAAAVSFATAHKQGMQPATSSNPSNIPPNAPSGAPTYGSGEMGGGADPAGMPGTSTLPHSNTWNPANSNYPQAMANPQYAPQIGAFPSIQSLDTAAAASAQQAGYRYYPMPPMMPGSASMPYGLSSPVVVSPYATLQLPNAAAIAAASAGVSAGDPGDVAAALQITRSLDQYNQQVIRSQLDQAHQSAQVASCQVQLLRDQLTSETTARLEAQSRTHQLLNSNRELLEQVKALVNRLQSLDVKHTSDIESQQQPGQHYQPSSLPATSQQQQLFTYSSPAVGPTPHYSSTGVGQQRQQQESRLPGPAPINPQRPYQMQTLAELRAGSLPPTDQQMASVSGFGSGRDNGKKNKTNGRRFQDDSGVRTEPESATEDTTDYSSSDQYERTGGLLMKREHEPTTSVAGTRTSISSVQQASSQPHYDVLLSNPQVMHNLSSYFQSSMQPFMQPPAQSPHSVVTSVAQPQAMVAQPLMPRRSSYKPRPSLPHSDFLAAETTVGTGVPAVPKHHYHRQPSPPPAQPQLQQQYVAQPLPPSVPLGGMATTSAQGAPPPTKQTSPKKTTRRFSLQPNPLRDEEGDEQGDIHPTKSKKSAAKGIFKEKDVGFSRMSFNTRLNNPGKKTDTSLINVPPSSSTINEEDDYPPGFSKDDRRRSSDGSRRKSLGAGQARTSISGSGSPVRQLDFSGMTEKQKKKEAIAAAAAATSGLMQQRAPASSSIATAMYPPIKKSTHSSANKPSSDLVKRGGFQALSIELDEPPLIVPAQTVPQSVLSAAEVAAIATAAAISATSGSRVVPRQGLPSGHHHSHHHHPQSSQQVIPNAAIDRVMRVQQQQYSPKSASPPTSNANYSSPRKKGTEINMNAEGGNTYLTHRPSDTTTSAMLSNNNRQLPDPDSVKGRTLLAMDAKKLSDPALLARLTGHYAEQRKDSEGNNLPNGVP